jgi:Aspartyl protease
MGSQRSGLLLVPRSVTTVTSSGTVLGTAPPSVTTVARRSSHLARVLRLLEGVHHTCGPPFHDVGRDALSYIHAPGCKEAVSDLVMVFPAQVWGSDASVMLDSGASCNATSGVAAKRLALDIQSPIGDPVGVKLADGHAVCHVGSTMLDLVIQGVQFVRVPCLVLDFDVPWDVLLGTPWLKAFRASLLFGEHTVRGIPSGINIFACVAPLLRRCL